MEVLRRLGHHVLELDRDLCHIVASGMFGGIFEVVIHDMPRDLSLIHIFNAKLSCLGRSKPSKV